MPLWTPPTLPGTISETTGTPTNMDGATITASGTAHVKGSYADLDSSTAEDAFGFYIVVTGVHQASTNTGMLLDIAIGAAGSEAIILPNLAVGAAGASGQSVKGWYFPIFIPKSSTVRARCQSVIVSDTAEVNFWLFERGLYAPDVCTRAETFGANTATSTGTSVPGAAASYGAWTQLGATDAVTQDLKYWTCSLDLLADTTETAVARLVELGIGPNSSTVEKIAGPFFYAVTTNETVCGPFPDLPIYYPIGATTTLWARMAANTGTEARGITAYGMR
jgi:hypothetical protein